MKYIHGNDNVIIFQFNNFSSCKDINETKKKKKKEKLNVCHSEIVRDMLISIN